MLPARAGLFPTPGRTTSATPCAPRASGAVPGSRWSPSGGTSCSPRERGCSRRRVPVDLREDVLPARAGLFPGGESWLSTARSAPRASGAVPLTITVDNPAVTCSPRERGCSPSGRPRGRRRSVLPARAGLFPIRPDRAHRAGRAPRASGAVPAADYAAGRMSPCSPRERGCSPRPTHYELSDLCSPRERGCSQYWTPHQGRPAVLPARAGLFPAPPNPGGAVRGAPRASGAVPVSGFLRWLTMWCSPRERGCSLAPEFVISRAPRASGAVPSGCVPPWREPACSPRERGCSPVLLRAAARRVVLPARAGLFPGTSREGNPGGGAPRASGAVPGG